MFSLKYQKSKEILDREGCHFWYQRNVHIGMRRVTKPEKEGVTEHGPRFEIFSWKYLTLKISLNVFGKLNYVAV